MQGNVEGHRCTDLTRASDLRGNNPIPGSATCQPRASSVPCHICCGCSPPNPYVSCSASTQRRPGQNLMTLKVALFLLSRHPIFRRFKRSIVHSTKSFIRFSDACSHCSGDGMWFLHPHFPHQHITGDKTMGYVRAGMYRDLGALRTQRPTLILPSAPFQPGP